MWDRAFLFSDEAISKRLKSEFVPVVANTHEVQTGNSPEKAWFMEAAVQVKPDIANHATAQGKYVFGADGTAYGFNNNRSTERLGQMLDSATTKFRANPPSHVDLPALSAHPSGINWPAGVAVVRSFARVRPVPEGCDPMNENVSRDHLWILAEEAKALGRNEFPESLVTRLCRFSLVDNVRGEPDHWKADEIELSQFWASGDGAFSGIVSMVTKDGKRGLQGMVEVEVAFREGKLTKFLAYCSALAWGRSTYTPGEPPGKFPMALAFTLVDDKVSRTVPPQAVFYGREYLGR